MNLHAEAVRLALNVHEEMVRYDEEQGNDDDRPAQVIGSNMLGQPLVTILVESGARDDVLQAAYFVRLLYGAKILTVVLEAYAVGGRHVTDENRAAMEQMLNDSKGTPGYLAKLFHDGSPHVVEVITACTVDQLGAASMTNRAFDTRPKPAEWHDPEHLDGVGGGVVDALRNLMSKPYLLDDLADRVGDDELAKMIAESRDQPEDVVARVLTKSLAMFGIEALAVVHRYKKARNDA